MFLKHDSSTTLVGYKQSFSFFAVEINFERNGRFAVGARCSRNAENLKIP